MTVDSSFRSAVFKTSTRQGDGTHKGVATLETPGSLGKFMLGLAMSCHSPRVSVAVLWMLNLWTWSLTG